MENYLYFAHAVVETGEDGASEALCVPAKNYIGADPIDATTTAFTFRNAYGLKSGVHTVKLSHTSGKTKEVIRAFMSGMNATPHSRGFVVMIDGETGTAVNKDAYVNPVFAGLGITVPVMDTNSGDTGKIRGVASGTTLAHSYGLGATSLGSGAAGAPQYARSEVGDIIITTIKIDLMGLKAKGGDAGDVIGVGTNPAYIYKNNRNENGVIFKQTISCLEVATSASGTVTDDINFAWNSAATIDYDEAGGTGSEINAGAMVTGQIVEDNTAAITEGHYAYLTEGSAEASDCVFATGQYLITLYGAKLATA